jgi:hypothetical protein
MINLTLRNVNPTCIELGHKFRFRLTDIMGSPAVCVRCLAERSMSNRKTFKVGQQS